MSEGNSFIRGTTCTFQMYQNCGVENRWLSQRNGNEESNLYINNYVQNRKSKKKGKD